MAKPYRFSEKALMLLFALQCGFGAGLFGAYMVSDFPSVGSVAYLAMVGVSGGLAWGLFRRRSGALQVGALALLLQVVELDAADWSFNLGMPIKLLLSWERHGAEYGLNLVALLALGTALFALRQADRRTARA